jgi:hypothetical protein
MHSLLRRKSFVGKNRSMYTVTMRDSSFLREQYVAIKSVVQRGWHHGRRLYLENCGAALNAHTWKRHFKSLKSSVNICQPAGLPDFSWYSIPKWVKYTTMTTKCTKHPWNIRKGSKETEWPTHLPTFFIARLSKIYPNWDFLVRNCTIWQPWRAEPKDVFQIKTLTRKLIPVMIPSCAAIFFSEQNVPDSWFLYSRNYLCINARLLGIFCF